MNTHLAQAPTATQDSAPPSRAAQPEARPVLQVEDLQITFDLRERRLHAVNGVSFEVRRGELLGIVGESGSGKSVTLLSLLRLLPSPPARLAGGSVRFDGTELTTLGDDALRRLRGGRIGYVFQDPMTSLNPVFTVGYQLVEPLRIHRGMSKRAARARAADLLRMVGIPSPESRLDAYPHQFSGGMRQRVMIAIALACEPELLIADEPTTALDVTIQAQILELVRDLRGRLGAGVVWITHDLGVVAGIADRVMVMYAGQVVEEAPVDALFETPRHPYTQALLATLPDHGSARRSRLASISGQPPVMNAPPSACPFAPRCTHVMDRCLSANPPLARVGEAHSAACWRAYPAETAHGATP
ncbi:MAG: ABC transporter ATP-binding protein [Pseudomonadota bacterium]